MMNKQLFAILLVTRFCLFVALQASNIAVAGGSLDRKVVHTLLIAEKLLSDNPTAKETFTEKMVQLTQMNKDALDLSREEAARCMSIESLRRHLKDIYDGPTLVKVGDKEVDGEIYYDCHCPKELYQSLSSDVVFNPVFRDSDKQVKPAYNPRFMGPVF